MHNPQSIDHSKSCLHALSARSKMNGIMANLLSHFHTDTRRVTWDKSNSGVILLFGSEFIVFGIFVVAAALAAPSPKVLVVEV